jgi:hypothetical protein
MPSPPPKWADKITGVQMSVPPLPPGVAAEGTVAVPQVQPGDFAVVNFENPLPDQVVDSPPRTTAGQLHFRFINGGSVATESVLVFIDILLAR